MNPRTPKKSTWLEGDHHFSLPQVLFIEGELCQKVTLVPASRRFEKESGDESPHSKMKDEHAKRVAQLAARIGRLSTLQVDEVDRLVTKLELAGNAKEIKSVDPLLQYKDWPHAPLHRLYGKGTYIVTAGTLNKEHLFCDVASLDLLESTLLTLAAEFQWQLEAWAVFSNHYHFVGHALEDAQTLKPFLSQLHAETAIEVNQRDNQSGRQVWFNYWDTELTYEKSYLARLNYVHQNAVHHGLALVANQYRWCSAAWFERTATPAQVKTIYSFKTDKIRVVDDFDVIAPK